MASHTLHELAPPTNLLLPAIGELLGPLTRTVLAQLPLGWCASPPSNYLHLALLAGQSPASGQPTHYCLPCTLQQTATLHCYSAALSTVSPVTHARTYMLTRAATVCPHPKGLPQSAPIQKGCHNLPHPCGACTAGCRRQSRQRQLCPRMLRCAWQHSAALWLRTARLSSLPISRARAGSRGGWGRTRGHSHAEPCSTCLWAPAVRVLVMSKTWRWQTAQGRACGGAGTHRRRPSEAQHCLCTPIPLLPKRHPSPLTSHLPQHEKLLRAVKESCAAWPTPFTSQAGCPAPACTANGWSRRRSCAAC